MKGEFYLDETGTVAGKIAEQMIRTEEVWPNFDNTTIHLTQIEALHDADRIDSAIAKRARRVRKYQRNL